MSLCQVSFLLSFVFFIVMLSVDMNHDGNTQHLELLYLLLLILSVALFIVMLNVVILSYVMLSVVALLCYY